MNMKTFNNIFMETLETFSSVSKPTTNKVKLNNKMYVQVPVCTKQIDGVYHFMLFNMLASNYNYGDLVNTFITLVYSNQEMTAIINNYLLDPTDEVALNEFNEMQNVRKEAKELAKHLLSEYPLS